MKFTAPIHKKTYDSETATWIKRALYWAPTNAKLLAYKTLCLPYLEHADQLIKAAGKISKTLTNSNIEQYNL